MNITVLPLADLHKCVYSSFQFQTCETLDGPGLPGEEGEVVCETEKELS